MQSMKIYYKVIMRCSIFLGIVSTLCLTLFSHSIGEIYSSNETIRELIQINCPFIAIYIGIDAVKFSL